MHTPQIVWIVLASMSLTVSLINHGKDKGKYNFWLALISVGIEFWIVWAGGFFGK